MSWIKGTIRFVDLGPGFFGIDTEDGRELLPVNMPEQLKYAGRKVEVLVKPVRDYVSVFMWGEAVHIIGFKTI